MASEHKLKIGFGTWKLPQETVAETVKQALCAGYRHLDLAFSYGNQKQVGEGIKSFLAESGTSREELFVTSKLWCSQQLDVENACKASLTEVGLEYFDLYLIHWPIFYRPLSGFTNDWGCGKTAEELVPIKYPMYSRNSSVPENCLEFAEFSDSHLQTLWRRMESLVAKGLVRNIGVSNCCPNLVAKILRFCETRPFCNQIESYPFLPNATAKAFLDKEGIRMVAYSPLRSAAEANEDPDVAALVALTGKTAWQLCLDWNLKRGAWVIPKSETPEFMAQNLAAEVDLQSLSVEGKELYEKVRQKFNEQRLEKWVKGRSKLVDGKFVFIENIDFA